jgi:uncharacterized protein
VSTSPLMCSRPEPLDGTRTTPHRGWIARHPLAAFFGWFFTVGQAFAFTPLLVDTGLPDQVFLIASTLLGLFLPAVVITRIVDGPDAARRFLRRFVAVGAPARWYALVLLVVPAVTVALGWLALGTPAPLPPSGWAQLIASGFALQLLLALVPNNWAEEGVWSGFVQARLQDRSGPARAAVLTGLLFALQHVSLAARQGLVAGAIALVLLAVMVVPYRFLTGWAWNRTGNLLLLGLLHAAGNAAAAGSGFGDGGVLRRLYPDDGATAGSLHLVAFALVGLVVLAATRGRLGLRRTSSATTSAAASQE